MDSLKNEFNKEDKNTPTRHFTFKLRKKEKVNLEEISNTLPLPDIKENNNIHFLKIDEKSTFEPQTEDYKEFTENYNTKKNKTPKQIYLTINKLFNKVCGTNINYNDDVLLISQNIAKAINKIVKIDKNYVDELIKDFVGASNVNLHKSDYLLLDVEACDKIGSMLCYCFSDNRLQQFKIKDFKKLLDTRQTVMKNGVNVYKEYVDYCRHKKETDLKITFFWKKQRGKYQCLPELIFLFNRFSKVKEIEFDINAFLKFEDNELNDAHNLFILLTLININIFLTSFKRYKINLIYEEFEKILYFKYYNDKFDLLCNKKNDIFKKNNPMNREKQFFQKWNFKYGLNCYDEIDDLNINKNKRSIKSIINDRQSFGEEDEISFEKNNEDNDNQNNQKEKGINGIIEDFLDRLELIIVCFFGLSNFGNYENLELTLIINDAFIQEYFILLSHFYLIDGISNIKDCFDIIDILTYSKKMSLNKKLNIEINSLDDISFEKFLVFLLKNKSLTSFNISLFSSDIIYFPQSLYKISLGQWKEDDLSENDTKNYLYNDVADLEKKILNKLFNNFTYHLSILFEILIKHMENLEEFGINIDTPPNLLNLQNYKNSILKFILNLLYFFSTNNKIKKACLLSPKTILDSRKMPYINEIFKNIDMIKASNLTDLTLNLQFVRISNIGNLISTQLQILNIGNLDLETFKKICHFLLNDKFNKQSSLKKISIGLLKNIMNFDVELKIILRKLFSIKIKSLISLSLYTNITIKDEIEYDYLLKILNNNWINEYSITLNSKSNQYFENFSEDIKNLYFFVPHSLEEKLLNPEDIYNYQENPACLELGKNLDKNDDAYWILKYLFENKYLNELSNDNTIKGYVKGILKYLYFQKKPNIKYYTDTSFKNH